MATGRFIVIDGIAGSGKSTITQAAAAWANSRGHSVFRLADVERKGEPPPHFGDLGDVEVLFTYEPTRTWIGGAIRAELARTDHPYDGVEMAHAFSLDRQMLYKRLILPALAAGKTVIQERSVSTSIVYQPIMKGGLSLEEILALPGNAQAMRRPPDHLILTHVHPETGVRRLANRDNTLRAFSSGATGVFLQLPYMKQVHERFHSDWYRELWERAGTKVHVFDAERPKEEAECAANELFLSLLELPKGLTHIQQSLCLDRSH